MDKKGFEKTNELLGFEIIDKKSSIVHANIEKFIQNIPFLLEKLDGRIKDNIRYLFYILSSICWMKGIYFSSLQKINKLQGTLSSFSNFCIPVFNISELTYRQVLDLVEVIQGKDAENKSLAALSIDFGILSEADLLVQFSRVASAALLNKSNGPLFLQANHLKFDGSRFTNDRENLLEELKRKTKEAIHLGIFNINYDASELVDMEASRISEKMLMNIKMVAMATNLWVRNFQPDGLVVSVSANMGMGGRVNSLPDEADVKEFLQRLLKEGSRLRFGVAGEDISKVEIPLPLINAESISQINQLNEVVRRETKLGGVVIDAGTISDIEAYSYFSGLRICELKLKPGKGLIINDHIKTILKRCGVHKVEFNINDFAMRMNRFPNVAEF